MGTIADRLMTNDNNQALMTVTSLPTGAITNEGYRKSWQLSINNTTRKHILNCQEFAIWSITRPLLRNISEQSQPVRLGHVIMWMRTLLHPLHLQVKFQQWTNNEENVLLYLS